MAVTATQTTLAGLPRRLVQDGLISEEKLVEATDAAKKQKVALVAYLVNEELADARAIAVAASHEFGVPLLELLTIVLPADCAHRRSAGAVHPVPAGSPAAAPLIHRRCVQRSPRACAAGWSSEYRGFRSWFVVSVYA